MAEKYDLIVAGTSFASSFFLHKYLARRAGKQGRVLVLERGLRRPIEWRLETGKPADLGTADVIDNRSPEKTWDIHVTFGGCSNSWWGCTPRFMPNDFRLQSAYGVGRDWPITYDELDPYYEEAERMMGVAGAEAMPYPRRASYPLPPHLLGEPEQMLAAAYPGLFVPLPCARWSLPQKNPARAQCCTAGVCTICPVDAKFTVLNSMSALYETPGVELHLNSPISAVEMQGNVATGVRYIDLEQQRVVKAEADLVVLGLNPIMNAFILQRSGMDHPMLGRRLGEQISTFVSVKLNGVKGFGGSTSLTGQGYMMYDGEHRRERAAALIEVNNIPRLRVQKERWREVMHFKVIVEVLPNAESKVGIDGAPDLDAPILGKPFTISQRHDEYTERTFKALPGELARWLKPLPVEDISIQGLSSGEAHITGTTCMGSDPADSVVDKNCVCHAVRNLVLPGCGVFTTTPPANPTLTLCALALRAADTV